MSYAYVKAGQFAGELIPQGSFVSEDGVATAWDALLRWTDDERRAIGIYALQEVQPEADPLQVVIGAAKYTVAGAKVLKTWATAPRALAVSREAAWSEVKLWREGRKFDALEFAGKWFQGDAESQRLISGAVQMAMLSSLTNTPFTIAWGALDDSKATMSADELMAFGMAFGKRTSTLWADADAAWTAISAATDTAGVRAAVDAFKTAHKAVAFLSAEQFVQTRAVGFLPDPFTRYVEA